MTKARRDTKQRRVILEEIQKLPSHPTAAELHEIVRRRLPRISLGTVYRNLELLVRDGCIRKLDIAGACSRYDGDLDRHLHVRCVSCEQVEDAQGAAVSELKEKIEGPHGYEVIGVRVELVGVCPVCRDQMPLADVERLRREWA